MENDLLTKEMLEAELLEAENVDGEYHYTPEEIKQLKLEKAERERLFIINNYSVFASVDVWAGICAAFRDMGYEVLPFAVHRLRALLSSDIMHHYIVASAISTKNNFTHVLFVGSAFIPFWVINSIQRAGIKVAYWSLEDPHALDQNGKFYGVADYYFTNERRVKDIFPNAIYLPTAGDHNDCVPPNAPVDKLKPEHKKDFDNDIVFCGNIYPNRQPLLEKISNFAKHKGYKFKTVGITAFMQNKENSPLKNNIIEKYDGVVDHRVIVAMYGYAKIAINMERDPLWEYNEKFSTNRKYKIIGESLNPRAYEICLTGGALQLIDNKRKELNTTGSLLDKEHLVVYENDDDLLNKIEHYLTHEEERKKITVQARKYCLGNHNYMCRAFRMLNAFRLKEGRKELVMKAFMDRILNKGN